MACLYSCCWEVLGCWFSSNIILIKLLPVIGKDAQWLSPLTLGSFTTPISPWKYRKILQSSWKLAGVHYQELEWFDLSRWISSAPGQFFIWKKSNFDLFTETLHGKFFLIRGNHDRLGRARYESRGVTIVNEPIYIDLDEKMKIIFSHWPVVPLDDSVINIHGHIQNSPPPPEGSALGPNHINMSIEVRNYRPWQLKDILQRIYKEDKPIF